MYHVFRPITQLCHYHFPISLKQHPSFPHQPIFKLIKVVTHLKAHLVVLHIDSRVCGLHIVMTKLILFSVLYKYVYE